MRPGLRLVIARSKEGELSGAVDWPTPPQRSTSRMCAFLGVKWTLVDRQTASPIIGTHNGLRRWATTHATMKSATTSRVCGANGKRSETHCEAKFGGFQDVPVLQELLRLRSHAWLPEICAGRLLGGTSRRSESR
jgi:hypothetical protein